MKIAVYRAFIALHPPGFRHRFGDELLCVFEEAARAGESFSLYCDAAVSIVRQWAFRTDLWVWCVALAGGLVPLIVGFGSFIPMLDFPMRP